MARWRRCVGGSCRPPSRSSSCAAATVATSANETTNASRRRSIGSRSLSAYRPKPLATVVLRGTSCGRQRDFRLDRAAAAGFALEEERAAKLANALAHVDEAHASGVAGAAGDEPDAVVADGQANDVSGAGEPDADLRRLRVLRDVAERLLRDAVERQRRARRQLLHAGARLAGDRDAARLAELAAIPGERLR